MRHTSTFAGNGLAAEVGLRSLDLLTRDGGALVRHVDAEGAHLTDGLRALQRRYPALIREVRGRGFMLGIEFTTDHGAFGRQCMMGSMAEQETLVLGLCSHLLHREGIRIAPTFFGTKVMRVEPPLVTTRALCDQFLDGLGRVLAL